MRNHSVANDTRMYIIQFLQPWYQFGEHLSPSDSSILQIVNGYTNNPVHHWLHYIAALLEQPLPLNPTQTHPWTYTGEAINVLGRIAVNVNLNK